MFGFEGTRKQGMYYHSSPGITHKFPWNLNWNLSVTTRQPLVQNEQIKH